MFIKSVELKNFRLFGESIVLNHHNIAVPDGENKGSGLTVLVGENGVGKSTIIDAISLPLISYKSDNLQLNDFTDLKQSVEIEIEANSDFAVKKSIGGEFQAKGFKFLAKVRTQNSNRYTVGTIVSDTYFVPVQASTFKPGSPDLRVAVENPFAGPRFNENDYVVIDKNRIKTLESGTYSSTRFDRILDNLNFQYLKANNNEPRKLHEAIVAEISESGEEIGNELLEQAFSYFEETTGYKVKLNLIDDTLPYSKAFLGFADINNEQIPIERIGSGYQMFLALICQHKLSLQSGKKLIILIDEAELNLHPRLQRELVDLLLTISKDSQVIISSHSPELLKDLQKCQYHKVNAIVRNGQEIQINPIEDFVLPIPTVSETNYVAFGLASMEYFIELYNQFGEDNECDTVTSIDKALDIPDSEKIEWEKENGQKQKLSVYSCVRNKFHHPTNKKNDEKFEMSYESIAASIVFLRNKLSNK